jgi:hypothetical protein
MSRPVAFGFRAFGGSDFGRGPLTCSAGTHIVVGALTRRSMRKFRHLRTLVVSFVGVFASKASADPQPVEPFSSSFMDTDPGGTPLC